jgi:hypothetical protein
MTEPQAERLRDVARMRGLSTTELLRRIIDDKLSHEARKMALEQGGDEVDMEEISQRLDYLFQIAADLENVEEGSEEEEELELKAHAWLLLNVLDFNLTGLVLWNDNGRQAQIGGSIFVKGYQVVWFMGDLEPDAEFPLTMFHSWLARPDEGEPVNAADAWRVTAQALQWALRENGPQHEPTDWRAAA